MWNHNQGNLDGRKPLDHPSLVMDDDDVFKCGWCQEAVPCTVEGKITHARACTNKITMQPCICQGACRICNAKEKNRLKTYSACRCVYCLRCDGGNGRVAYTCNMCLPRGVPVVQTADSVCRDRPESPKRPRRDPSPVAGPSGCNKRTLRNPPVKSSSICTDHSLLGNRGYTMSRVNVSPGYSLSDTDTDLDKTIDLELRSNILLSMSDQLSKTLN